MSSWKGGVNPFNGWKRIHNPDNLVRDPHIDAVDMWFETGGCLVGGADAHCHKIFGKSVFDYRMLFDRVRTHILLDKPFREPSQFTEALRQGRCFMSNAIAGDASEYRSLVSGGMLYLKLPSEARVSLKSKGQPFTDSVSLEKGVHCLGSISLPAYIEIQRDGRTWIAQGIH